MQFLPDTWKGYGVEGDRDGRADVNDPYDAVPAAARYLCANGAGRGGQEPLKAIRRYNRSDAYVRNVLALARVCTRQLRPRMLRTLTWISGSQVSIRGCRQRRPGKRAKSLSVVIHSQPDSMASAAKYASGIRFPFALAL